MLKCCSGKITTHEINNKASWKDENLFDIDDILATSQTSARQQYVNNSRYFSGRNSNLRFLLTFLNIQKFD